MTFGEWGFINCHKEYCKEKYSVGSQYFNIKIIEREPRQRYNEQSIQYIPL